MNSYDPPYKTMFLICYSAVAAVVATEAKPDAYVAELSHQEFVEEFEKYLAENEEHPWCGFGRMDDTEFGYLIPDGDNGAT